MTEISELKQEVNDVAGVLKKALFKVQALERKTASICEKDFVKSEISVEHLAAHLGSMDQCYQWMPLKLFCAYTGYTAQAIKTKIYAGKLAEGTHYQKSKLDGKYWIHYPNFSDLNIN